MNGFRSTKGVNHNYLGNDEVGMVKDESRGEEPAYGDIVDELVASYGSWISWDRLGNATLAIYHADNDEVGFEEVEEEAEEWYKEIIESCKDAHGTEEGVKHYVQDSVERFHNSLNQALEEFGYEEKLDDSLYEKVLDSSL